VKGQQRRSEFGGKTDPDLYRAGSPLRINMSLDRIGVSKSSGLASRYG